MSFKIIIAFAAACCWASAAGATVFPTQLSPRQCQQMQLPQQDCDGINSMMHWYIGEVSKMSTRVAVFEYYDSTDPASLVHLAVVEKAVTSYGGKVSLVKVDLAKNPHIRKYMHGGELLEPGKVPYLSLVNVNASELGSLTGGLTTEDAIRKVIDQAIADDENNRKNCSGCFRN